MKSLQRHSLVLLAILVASICPLRARADEAEEAERVQFLLAVDTVTPGAQTWARFGSRSRAGHDSASHEKRGLHRGGQRPLQHSGVARQRHDRKNVSWTISAHSTRPLGDTLVFYYTGHGGFYPEKGHLLAMYNQNKRRPLMFNRKELLSAIADCPRRSRFRYAEAHGLLVPAGTAEIAYACATPARESARGCAGLP